MNLNEFCSLELGTAFDDQAKRSSFLKWKVWWEFAEIVKRKYDLNAKEAIIQR